MTSSYQKLINLFPVDNIVQDMESLMDKSFEKAINKMNNYCPIDIYDDHDQYVIAAECPGYSENQLNVQVVDGCMIEISGDRKEFVESTSERKYMLKERILLKTFTRKVDIPRDADADSIDANLEEGILYVMLKKKDQQTRGKKVNINVQK
jgi:HSP20 family protein